MTSGIYCIKNIRNGKRYIGSSVNIKARQGGHISRLRCNYNENPLLQADYLKYGKDSFSFYVLEYLPEEKLYEREYYWIECHKSDKKEHGYNMRISRRCNHPRKTNIKFLNMTKN